MMAFRVVGPNAEQILVFDHVVALFGDDIASHGRFKSASLRRTTAGTGQSLILLAAGIGAAEEIAGPLSFENIASVPARDRPC
jgi:hypothetical protein